MRMSGLSLWTTDVTEGDIVLTQTSNLSISNTRTLFQQEQGIEKQNYLEDIAFNLVTPLVTKLKVSWKGGLREREIARHLEKWFESRSFKAILKNSRFCNNM